MPNLYSQDSDAYSFGYASYELGAAQYHNPYSQDNSSWYDWYDGWLDAKQYYEEREDND